MNVVHILGVAHSVTELSSERHPNPTDAFATLTCYLSKLLHRAGYTVYVYAVEGSVLEECTEVVPVVSRATYDKQYADRDETVPNSYSETKNDAWTEFTKNAVAEVTKRMRSREDIVCAMFGWAHEPTTSALKARLPAIIEPAIGHPGSYADFRVFCSHAWFYWECSRQRIQYPSDYFCVIPHFLDESHYPSSLIQHEGHTYAVYLGRVQFDKGLTAAVECTRVMGMKLMVIGSGKLSAACPGCDTSHVECLGVLGLSAKREILAGAYCCFAMTRYCEPWNLAALEAQFCGTPVLCNKFGGFTEFVVHGATGFHCDTLGTVCHFFRQCATLDRTQIRARMSPYTIASVTPMYLAYFDRIRDFVNGRSDWYTVNPRKPFGMGRLVDSVALTHYDTGGFGGGP